MNKYLESIQSMDVVGTGMQGQIAPDSAVVLEVSGEPPGITYVNPTDFDENITQESVSYSAPQKVIVRTYRLRK